MAEIPGSKPESAIDSQPASSDEAVTPGEEQEVPVLARSLIAIGLFFALFVVGLDIILAGRALTIHVKTIIATAIPKITDQFNGIDLIGWYSAAFYIFLACSHPIWGKLYQFFSLKYVFIASVAVFELGSLIAAVSPNSVAFIIGRLITGAGGAGIVTGSYAILTTIVRKELRAIFTGLITSVYSTATVLGPIFGGLFAEHATWRWCFYISLPLGGISAVTTLLFYHPAHKQRPNERLPFKTKLAQFDVLGVVLALGAVICFARATQVAGISKPWDSAEVIGLLVTFGVLLIILVFLEKFLDARAMIVHHLVRQRYMLVAMLYGFFHEAAFFTLIFALPIYFQVVGGVSPAEAGVRNLPLLLTGGICSMLAGFVISKWPYPIPVMVFASGGGVLGTGLLYTLQAQTPNRYNVGYQIIAGVCYGLGMPLALITGHAYTALEDIPLATAMLLLSICYGDALSLTAAQSILDNTIVQRIRVTLPDLDPMLVIKAGASDIQSKFDPEVVPLLIDAYLSGLKNIYILIMAFAGAALISALFYRWEKLGGGK